MPSFPPIRWSLLFALLVGMTAFLGNLVSADPVRAPSQNYLPVAQKMPPPTATPTATSTPTPSPTATMTPSPTPTVPAGTVTPNDPNFPGQQWPLAKIRAQEGWRITTGREVVIAVIDSGVDLEHPELAGRLADPSHWWDFVNKDGMPQDGNGHGTHVAGIAAAASNNGQGIAGTSWGARILPLQVLADDGSGYMSNVALAVRHAADRGARVINLSVGGPSYVSTLQDAIHYARSRGAVVIASAGNCYEGGGNCSGVNAPSYPAKMAGVIAVAATTLSDGHASYSNADSYVDLAAPGGDRVVGVLSTYPQQSGGYAWFSGTSMAAPHVSGVAALILGERPYLSPDDIEFILKSSAVDLGAAGWDPFFGQGRIDMRRALEVTFYWQATGQAAGDRFPVRAESGEGATAAGRDCSLPHAPDRIFVREGSRQHLAGPAGIDGQSTQLLAELPGWQLLQVPTGQACQLVRALNDSAGEGVAELDLVVTAPAFSAAAPSTP